MKMKQVFFLIVVAVLPITTLAAVEPLMEQISWANVDTNNTFLSADSDIVTNALIILTESHSHVTNAVEGTRLVNPAKNLASNDGFYGPDDAGFETGEAAFITNAYSVGKGGDGYYMEYTLQNNSTTNLQLADLRFDLIRRWGGGDFKVRYASGDLLISDGTLVTNLTSLTDPNATWGLFDPSNEYIVDMTALGDSILDAGESATFRFNFDVNVPATAIDNMMFLGEFGVLDNANIAPSFTNNPIRLAEIATIGVAYSNDLSGIAVDPEGDTIHYAKTDGPSWLDILPDGTVIGTPVVARFDEFTISATDSNSAPAEAIIEVVVTDPQLEAYEMVAWTGENNRFADTKTPGAGQVSAQMFDAINGVNLNRNAAGGSEDHNYGTIFMTPVAEDNSWVLRAQSNQVYTIAITNKTVFDMDLDGIYFDYKRNFPEAPGSLAVNYVSGDLDDTGPVGIGSYSAIDNTWVDLDLPFTNLTDTVIQAGEHVAFTLSFSNFSGPTRCLFDNFMVRMLKGDASDTDNDNIADNWEINYFGSITNSDGTADFEPDGFNDYSEFIAGTNPTNALSLLNIDVVEAGTNANEYVIQWQSAGERSYRIMSAENLVFPIWITNASGIAATPATNITTVTNTLSPAFFRVEVE
ncbi:putative Ig domain-containing protein [Pontiella sulfatireligans]|uniref:Dystroglycan-type cadherin-like domain-containing protein n=1 Tax=Pontiella sulfatireligans TaxID=2750658 RepID=A0A6C2URL0_9BACT|nr:putative Ig domain-containing protein [Pontiella sulfatireligans]VGO21881.1 hypothetical protein SCARR_03961 [Pontiella sulfatireligans]